MKILILGAGGVGGYFGAHLIDAGVDVTFLVRPRRAMQLRERGLRVHGTHGELKISPIKLIESGTRSPATSSDSEFDIVILTCKAYDLDSSIEAVRPYATRAMILPLLNGIRHMDILDRAFGATRVLGGLAQVSTTLNADGDIQQITPVHNLIYGARDPSQTSLAERFDAAIKGVQFDARLSQQIMLEIWEKFVLLATLAGSTCLLRANIGEIARTQDGSKLVNILLDDCAAIASAAGYAPREQIMNSIRGALTKSDSLLEASMRRDMEQGRTTEADHVLGDLLQRASSFGIESTLLRAAYCHMQAHEQRLAITQRGNA